MWVLLALFCGLTSGYIAPTSQFNTSITLAEATEVLKVVFLDFDRTMMVASFGDFYLNLCDPSCSTYNQSMPCNCNGTNQLGDYFVANHLAQALNGSDNKGINGTDRRDRLIQMMQLLTSRGIKLHVLSTAWYSVGHAAWAYFIDKVMNAAGLGAYLNISNIIALDDPGQSIAADKGSAAQAVLNASNWTKHQGILVDDSPTNIITASAAGGRVDWLQVTPRSGIALDAIVWLETRAGLPASMAPTAAPTNSAATTFAPGLAIVVALVGLFFQ